MGVFTAFSGGKIFSGFPGFSAPAERGARTAAGGFALTGRLLFCTGQPGCANCRRRVRPFRAESFSLNLCGGIRRLRTAGALRRPPRGGAKRKDNLRFSFLFELLPFPCFLIWRRLPICDRFENRNGSRVTAACLSPPFRSSQTAYCYTYGQLYAGRGIAVPRNS